MISVVIPVRDGGEDIRRCLEAINRQRTSEDVEVLVIDSGSTDGTPDVATELGARVHRIAPEEFNHGATRNLGAELAKGELVAFTVDDALPVGERWLESLVQPLRASERLAGAYARQVAREDARPNQRVYLEWRYGPEPRVQRAERPAELTVSAVLFSNVGSVVRKSVLQRFPFADDILTAEDLDWCARVLLEGYEIAYVPEAVVRHSHRSTLRGAFRRYFDQGSAAERSFLGADRTSPRAVRGTGLAYLRHEVQTLWREREGRAIPYALAFEAARFAGYQLGVRHRLVPRWLRPHLSIMTGEWSGR